MFEHVVDGLIAEKNKLLVQVAKLDQVIRMLGGDKTAAPNTPGFEQRAKMIEGRYGAEAVARFREKWNNGATYGKSPVRKRRKPRASKLTGGMAMGKIGHTLAEPIPEAVAQ